LNHWASVRKMEPKVLVVQVFGAPDVEHSGSLSRSAVSDAELKQLLLDEAHSLGASLVLKTCRTISELESILSLDQLVEFSGLLINPGVGVELGAVIRKFLLDVGIKKVEVHTLNPEAAGIKSQMTSAVDGFIVGFGLDSYILGLRALLDLINRERSYRN
jgi:3-dehydroquinate dehydratase-2